MQAVDIWWAVLFGGIALLAQYLPPKWGIPIGLVAIGVAVYELKVSSLSPSWQAITILVILTIIAISWRIYTLKRHKHKDYRKAKLGGNKVLIGLGIGIIAICIVGIVGGSLLIRSQLNIRDSDQTQDTVGTLGFQMPTYIDASQQVSISIGTNLVVFKWSDLQQGGLMPFSIDGQPVPITIFTKDEGGNHWLYANVKIVGSNNISIVELDKNTLVSQLPEGWDRNSDQNAFEVVNTNKEPILQIIRDTPFGIGIAGIFPLPNGGLVTASPSGGLQLYGSGVANQALLQGFHLTPIFKYPSNQYLGVRVSGN